MTEIQRILLSNIKKYRSVLNYSQNNLAELCGVSPSYISEIETGKKFPSAKTLQSIVKALEVKPYKLFLDDTDIDNYDMEGLLDDLKDKITHQVANEIDAHYKSNKYK